MTTLAARRLPESLAVAAALRAASHLGIARRLVSGSASVSDIASACCLNERGARSLMVALASMGLIEHLGEGVYRAQPWLECAVEYAELWERLPQALSASSKSLGGDRPAIYPASVKFLSDMFGEAADQVAELLTANGIVPRRILDLGAGGAAWSMAVAARAPASCVTALDLSDILEVTRSIVTDAGFASQYRYLAGDVFEVNLDGPYDLILLGNICHLFGADANRRLLRRVHHALEPGGCLAIVDVTAATGTSVPERVALYELSLVLGTEVGAVHSFSSLAVWLRAAGFSGLERFPLEDPHGLGLIVARRSDQHHIDADSVSTPVVLPRRHCSAR